MSETEVLAPDGVGVARAGTLLRAGRLVAFPTETVYGLGADATDARAVALIYEAKGRPRFNPLIVHVADTAEAEALIALPEAGHRLAARHWPGPLTLVGKMRAGASIADLVTAGLPTLAVRVPAHPVARALLRETGRPLAAPSANPSGKVSPTTAHHVLDGLSGRISAVLDGGACPVGLESTIVGFDAEAPVLLRKGGVAVEDIAALVGWPAARSERSEGAERAITAPGQLDSHYAPDAQLRLDAGQPRADEVYLGFGPGPGDLNLSPDSDLVEAAANLFAYLRRLDVNGRPIAVAPIPETGLGRAINDRLRRAAAPR